MRYLRAVLCVVVALALSIPTTLLCTTAYASQSDNKTVRVGWFESDLFQEGAEGEPKSGYSYNYLRKLSNYASWNYEYVYGDWSDLYDKLCRGEIDFMAGMSYSEERASLMLFPDQAMETDKYYLYKHSGDSSIVSSDLSTFDGKKIGLLRNNRISEFAESWIEARGVNAQTIYYDTFDSLHAAFKNGEIDLEPRTVDGASDSPNIVAAVSLGEEPSYLAVSNQRPDLLQELDNAIAKMESVEPYALQELQYATYGSVYTSRALSDEEQAWLEQHPVVKVGYIDNYLPYCATGSNGQATGLFTNVLDAIFSLLEVDTVPQFQYVAYKNYESIAAALVAGEIDLGFPVSDNEWTLEQDGVIASENVISDRGVLFYGSSCDRNNIDKVAAVEGNAFQDEYTALVYPDVQIVYYTTIDECLDAVVKGEVDGTVMDSLRVQYVTDRPEYNSLQYVQLNDVTGKCFGFAQGDSTPLMLMNRGLKTIGSSYGYDRAFQYVDQLYSYGAADFVKDNPAGVAAFAAILIAIVIVLLVLYIRKQRQELALREALQREAEEANAAKSRFLFNMSHDIRTPMNAVLGFNDLMLENIDDPDKLRDYIEKSKLSGDYLLGLINNVLEVARIDSGQETINEEFADLMDASYGVVFENDVRQKHLDFTQEMNIEHRYVYTDAHKIREILLNVLSNAIKYTPDGGSVHLELVERPCDRAGYASYECNISDTGIGMTEEFQQHIFDTFAREHNSTESKVMGTGLGMAIVKKLTDLLGATVEVESKLGEGTTFRITMDMRIVQNPEEYLQKEQAVVESAEAFRLDGRRILVAEDNELNMEIAKALLENLGATVEVAPDGVVCVDMLTSHEPGYYDAILMDIQMPNLNGYDAAKKIRALDDAGRSGIPIVAMTANAFDEDRKAALHAGMDAHVSKPIDVTVLMKTLSALLG